MIQQQQEIRHATGYQKLRTANSPCCCCCCCLNALNVLYTSARLNEGLLNSSAMYPAFSRKVRNAPSMRSQAVAMLVAAVPGAVESKDDDKKRGKRREVCWRSLVSSCFRALGPLSVGPVDPTGIGLPHVLLLRRRSLIPGSSGSTYLRSLCYCSSRPYYYLDGLSRRLPVSSP